jgi:hypothetical protein
MPRGGPLNRSSDCLKVVGRFRKGQNECKGHDATAVGGEEAAVAKHDCKGQNACKGQGGCKVEGKNECKGHNECKGQGGCKTT